MNDILRQHWKFRTLLAVPKVSALYRFHCVALMLLPEALGLDIGIALFL
jgi:hypothetical protein